MMTEPRLTALALRAGIQIDWTDVAGRDHTVTPAVLRTLLGHMGLPADSDDDIEASEQRLNHDLDRPPPMVIGTAGSPIPLPGTRADDVASFQLTFETGGRLTGTLEPSPGGRLQVPAQTRYGYHELCFAGRRLTLAVAPTRCATLADCCGGAPRKMWGLSAQIYSLRDDWAATGAGDYSALARLARSAAGRGCHAIAISPVHAMFSALPERCSPYAPSSRLFCNAIYIDPLQTFAPDALAAAIRAHDGALLREPAASSLVDWPEVARIRLAILRQLFEHFPENATRLLQHDFREYQRRAGAALQAHALFEALHAHFGRNGMSSWRTWPAAYHDPAAPAAAAFAREHARDVEFHAFLQWLAERGLDHAHQSALDSGMEIGLIGDLAVGTSPDGSHAWSRQPDILPGLSPGAPPDIYNPAGQAWGLCTFGPRALRQRGYAAYIEMLRANLRHTGGVRIDHVMGMQRTWMVPDGAAPADGAYVRYPLTDLLHLTALESVRHRAIIMGENLGTVPDGFNQRIHAQGMLGMSVLWFERNHEGFKPAPQWEEHNIATTSTHDLPTVAGWWTERDLDWQETLSRDTPIDTAPRRAERVHERYLLWNAIKPPQCDPAPPQAPPIGPTLAWVGRTPAPLALIPLEDLLGVVEQPNLPGTVDEHPNWRRRLPLSVQGIFREPDILGRLDTLNHAREGS